MIKGYLIYDKERADRNVWFIKELIKEARIADINLELIVIDSNINSEKLLDCNFAIIRTISSSLTKLMTDNKIKVFNNRQTALVANDKWLTYRFCQNMGVQVMPTELINRNNFSCGLKYPIILKTRNGHGGKEVFWVKDESYLTKIMNYEVLRNQKDFIVQNPSDTIGKDCRVYMLGNRCLASVLRYSDDDFRSNYSLGGKIKLFDMDDYQMQTVKAIASKLKSDFIGIDFIMDNGLWKVNEIEDIVGCRMLYELTTVNVAKKYIDYIKNCL